MYLMDALATVAAQVDGDNDPILRAYPDLVARLGGAPRYLLDAKACHTAVELNIGRPKIILEAMRHLRIPYTRLWCEWDDADRQKLRDKFDEPLTFEELRPLPGRVGFMLEAEPNGRRGRITWSWTTPKPGVAPFPNIGAIETRFDLDRIFELSPERVEGLTKGNLAQNWMDNPVQVAALFDIWRHAEFGPSQWGKAYFAIAANNPLVKALAYSDVVGEWIMAIAVLLMLTSSSSARPVVDYVPIVQSKLNKHRLKRGAVPLLDHTRVTLHLSAHDGHASPGRRPIGYTRKSPRVHLVSSYLARRGTRHWVVSPYWRGEGETISRHVNVKG